MLNARRNLALAINEQGIMAAQIAVSNDRRSSLRTASLKFSGEAGMDQPERLGKELKKALHDGGLTESRCMVGIAATWIAAREKSLPLTDAESLRGVMSIAAEREFGPGPAEMAFDYVAWKSENGQTALLAATQQRIVQQILAVAKAAGLTVTAITASASALAAATGGDVPPSGRAVLCLLPGGAELAIQSAEGLRLIRHLPLGAGAPADRLATLCGELRRVFSLASADRGLGQVRELLVWDAAGQGQVAGDVLAEQLGVQTRVCSLKNDLVIQDVPSGASGGEFAAAAALACLAGRTLSMDFLHSRLSPPRERRFGLRTRWAAVAAAALLAVGVYMVLHWQATVKETNAMQKELDQLKDASQKAKALVDNMSVARGWYDRRPQFLNCMMEIAGAFPAEGKIWATRLTITEDMQATLTGSAVNREAVLEVRDRMMSDRKLANVELEFVRPVGGNSHDVSFALRMTLVGAN